MDLKGKIAVVAGASGGIGKEVSLALARGGVETILVARRRDVLAALKDEISDFKGKAHIFECDLMKPTSVGTLVSSVERKFPRVDILINAAGIGVYKKLEEVNYEEWERSLALNVTVPFLLTQKLIPLLKKSEGSVVISMGSGMGKVALAGRSTYCTSKFALRGLMLSLAKEYKKTNIKITLLTLGSVHSQPSPRQT